MTTDIDRAMREAEEAASGPYVGFFNQLADRVGVRANARAVFGDPVDREGITVIPVAKVRWGFGGGAGSGGKGAAGGAETGEGAGGGGGAVATPLGFIEVRDGEAIFRRIKDPAAVWPLVIAGAIATWITLRGFRALFR
jgi:uncharacterized spore protein YtfJ